MNVASKQQQTPISWDLTFKDMISVKTEDWILAFPNLTMTKCMNSIITADFCQNYGTASRLLPEDAQSYFPVFADGIFEIQIQVPKHESWHKALCIQFKEDKNSGILLRCKWDRYQSLQFDFPCDMQNSYYGHSAGYAVKNLQITNRESCDIFSVADESVNLSK